MELAGLLAHRAGAEALPLEQLLAGDRGWGIIDPRTHHTKLPVIIARVEGEMLRPIARLEPVTGDPSLTRPRIAVAPALPGVS